MIDDGSGEARQWYVFFRRLHEERRTGVKSRYGEAPSPRWDGGRDMAGKTWKPVWPRIAASAARLNAPLRDYLAAQFRVGEAAPWPNQCHGEKAAQRYGERRDMVLSVAAARLRAEHQEFAMRSSAERLLYGGDEESAARRALALGSSALSPLYRYCVAVAVGDRALADRFVEAAKLQYLTGGADAYRRAWSSLLPPGFIAEVERDVEDMRSNHGGGG